MFWWQFFQDETQNLYAFKNSCLWHLISQYVYFTFMIINFFGPFCQKHMFSLKNKFKWNILKLFIYCIYCRNLSLGLATKARAYKGVGQEGSSRVTSHALRSVGELEGMNPHIFKWAFTLGVGVPMDSRIFREWLQGSKLIQLKNSLHYWKAPGK